MPYISFCVALCVCYFTNAAPVFFFFFFFLSVATSRPKNDSLKLGCTRPRLSPDPEPEMSSGNETMLRSVKDMMEEMRSDIVTRFESIISETVKKKIASTLNPLEEKVISHGGAILGLERSSNDHESQLGILTCYHRGWSF